MVVEESEEPGPIKQEQAPKAPPAIVEQSAEKPKLVPKQQVKTEPPLTMEAFTQVFLEFLREEDLPEDREYDTDTLEDCGLDELALSMLASKLKDVWPSKGGRASKFPGGKLIDLYKFIAKQ